MPAIGRPPGATSSVISPGLALQQGVVLALESRRADAIDVGAPDDAAAGVAAGHHPPVLAVDADADEVERSDLLTDLRVGLAGDVEEAAVARLASA